MDFFDVMKARAAGIPPKIDAPPFDTPETHSAFERNSHFIRTFSSPNGLDHARLLAGPRGEHCRLLQDFNFEFPNLPSPLDRARAQEGPPSAASPFSFTFVAENKEKKIIMIFQYECLEMTLDGGLDELKKLKNLRVLDVHWIDQRIGVMEFKWMIRHWPRLEVLQGLYDHGRNLEAARWLKKHSPTVKVELNWLLLNSQNRG